MKMKLSYWKKNLEFIQKRTNMKIFTVLGTLCIKEEEKWAKYSYDENLRKEYSLKRGNYTNMFPLLVDNFGAKNVFSIYTDTAKEKQEKTLSYEFEEDFAYGFNKEYHIDDEKDFYKTFKILNKAIDISKEEDVILDLTHSFRHIPILATIALISRNLQGRKNIKHIFFAKEVVRQKEYEIIDLKEYLEIANLSIMLENFSDNYTLTSNTEFENEDYQELTEDLRDVSNAILANSIKRLYEANLLQKTKSSLEKISKEEAFLGYKSSFNKTIKHIDKLLKLEKLSSYERLYEMSKLMNEKGYLLNAITLIHEAVGFYCVEGLKNISPEIKSSFDDFLKTNDKRKNYLLSSFSMAMVQNKGHVRRGDDENKILKKRYDSKIKSYLKSILEIKKFIKYIKEVKSFRNNLTHANSSDRIENSKSTLAGIQTRFENFCIKQDILKQG